MDFQEFMKQYIREVLGEQRETHISKVDDQITEITETAADDSNNVTIKQVFPLSGCGCVKPAAIRCNYPSCSHLVCNDCFRECAHHSCGMRLCRAHYKRVGKDGEEKYYCLLHYFSALLIYRISKIWGFFNER